MTAPVVVTGFGRCGSTMLMTMLRAGGIPFAAGANEHSGEHPSLEHGIAAARPGAVVKLLDPTQPSWALPPQAATWTFLWLDRDLIQQSRSWAKFCAAFLGERPGPYQQLKIRQAWVEDRAVVMAEKLPGHVHTLRYEDVLTNPSSAAHDVAAALTDYELDTTAMAAVVHDRTPECRPDLSVEFGTAGSLR